MQSVQRFDFDCPNPETLVGIYVEASDRSIADAAYVNAAEPPKYVENAMPSANERFGLTLCVDDGGAEAAVSNL